MDWVRILAYITGTVDQELLLRNEYLAAENRILKAQIKGRLLLPDTDKITLAEIAHRLGRKALEDVANTAKPDTIMGAPAPGSPPVHPYSLPYVPVSAVSCQLTEQCAETRVQRITQFRRRAHPPVRHTPIRLCCAAPPPQSTPHTASRSYSSSRRLLAANAPPMSPGLASTLLPH